MIIAIDGPAASGKSTISKLLAEQLGYTYIDTGAMYRAVALAYIQALRERWDGAHDCDDYIESDAFKVDPNMIASVLAELELDFDGKAVVLNDKVLGDEIRGPEVSNIVAKVAAVGLVREKLVAEQRRIAGDKDVVMDGRDIGTVVFPNADLKIYMIASAEVRAKRRFKDFEAQGVKDVSLEELVEDIQERDRIDFEREVSPLCKADDAVELNTDDMSIDEVLGFVAGKVGSVSKA